MGTDYPEKPTTLMVCTNQIMHKKYWHVRSEMPKQSVRSRGLTMGRVQDRVGIQKAVRGPELNDLAIILVDFYCRGLPSDV